MEKPIITINKKKEEKSFPWNENVLVESIYTGDNYKVLDANQASDSVIIFFSGNGLYFPNTQDVFKETICDKNRYEWEHIGTRYLIKKNYSKIIFLRDIYKQWYVKGINRRADSVEKVVELIQNLTKGYNVVTCGNSAGGYMAMLVGKKIGAKRIFSFSGQFSVWNQLYRAPLLDYYKKETDVSKYYNLSDLLNQNGVIFHFYPAHAIQDIEQMKLIGTMDKDSFYTFAFDEKLHGKTVDSDCYEYLLTMDSAKLVELSRKYKLQIINKADFSEDVLFCHNIFERNKEHVEQILRGRSDLYIWGTGDDGEKCYRLFKRVGLKIRGIIDNYKKQNTWHGYNVIRPNEIGGGASIICIATKKYESEIIDQLQMMKVAEDQYVCFEQLKEQILMYLNERKIL